MTDAASPVTSPGLDRLVAVVAELLQPRSIGAVGDDVAAAFERTGISTSRPSDGPASVDVLVSIDDVGGASLEQAREHVARLAQSAARAVVFSPAADDSLRFMPWWDALFADQGFEPIDVLRTRLWEEDSWDAEALSGLSLYVRGSERPTVDIADDPVPRSAVHPGLLVQARRERSALHSLAAGVRPDGETSSNPVVVVQRALDERSGEVDAAREELRTSLARARDAVQAVRLEAERTADDLADAHRKVDELSLALERSENSRNRSEHESRLLREERDAVVAAAMTPVSSPSAMASLARRAGTALGRRVEMRALGAADRMGAVPGAAGRVIRRSASVYRSVTTDWREATRALFDTDHYLGQRPGLVGSGVDPVVHYSRIGWREGLDPHPLFDTDWYVRENQLLLVNDVSPLEHYFATGWREGFDPHPLFDTDFYLRRSKDVAVADTNALVHYIDVGWRQGRDPHPLFETNRYLHLYPDVRDADVCPLVHYVTFGWTEGCSPSKLFDAGWYVDRYPEVAASGLPPYRYFLEIGVQRGDLPSEWAERLHEPQATSNEDRVVA